MSRADKTQTEITYDLLLDEARAQLDALEVTILCAMRSEGCGPQQGAGALSRQQHVAFKLVYRFSDQDALDRFPVPDGAAKLLR